MVRALWRKFDRKVGEMSQERFNTIMYVILFTAIAIGWMYGLNKWANLYLR